MKILFTGASSFTGMWFVQALSQAGHDVTATFQRPLESYSGIRRERIQHIMKCCRPVFDVTFGDDAFLKLISTSDWDLFCHHAADVNDYKSPHFDIGKALANNTKQLATIINLLLVANCQTILLTGSVFEPHEGQGTENLRAVSPYGLSKSMTHEIFSYYSKIYPFILGKFVIPNPFGTFEENRFTNYLAKTWMKGETPSVNTPNYVRDNIPVPLLAKAYVSFAHELASQKANRKYSPSFFTESQGAFTHRFAKAMAPRLSVKCDFELKDQIDFSEPLIRINVDRIDSQKIHFDEELFWDDLAQYYMRVHAK